MDAIGSRAVARSMDASYGSRAVACSSAADTSARCGAAVACGTECGRRAATARRVAIEREAGPGCVIIAVGPAGAGLMSQAGRAGQFFSVGQSI